MTDLDDWPDTYVALSEALSDLAAIGPETPADPDGTYGWLPFIRVQRVGGSDDRITDSPVVAIGAFDATRQLAAPLAGRIRQRLLNTPLMVPGKALIDSATTATGPMEVPYGDVKRVRLFTATYQVQLRRY